MNIVPDHLNIGSLNATGYPVGVGRAVSLLKESVISESCKKKLGLKVSSIINSSYGEYLGCLIERVLMMNVPCGGITIFRNDRTDEWVVLDVSDDLALLNAFIHDRFPVAITKYMRDMDGRYFGELEPDMQNRILTKMTASTLYHDPQNMVSTKEACTFFNDSHYPIDEMIPVIDSEMREET